MGEFDAYYFNGTFVDTSTMSNYTIGSGTIEWQSGKICYMAKVNVTAAGFLPVKAAVFGTGKIISSTQIELNADNIYGEEIGRGNVIPSLTIYGIIVFVLLLVALGIWRLRSTASDSV